MGSATLSEQMQSRPFSGRKQTKLPGTGATYCLETVQRRRNRKDGKQLPTGFAHYEGRQRGSWLAHNSLDSSLSSSFGFPHTGKCLKYQPAAEDGSLYRISSNHINSASGSTTEEETICSTKPFCFHNNSIGYPILPQPTEGSPP